MLTNTEKTQHHYNFFESEQVCNINRYVFDVFKAGGIKCKPSGSRCRTNKECCSRQCHGRKCM